MTSEHTPVTARTDSLRVHEDSMPFRVMLVDDDRPVRVTTARNLRAAGIRVIGAQDGEEAIRLLRTLEFDAVVSDPVMPHLNGIGLARAIRELDPALHTVLVSGHPCAEATVTESDLGGISFLKKPVDAAALVETTERVAKMTRLAREEMARLRTRSDARTPEEDEALGAALTATLRGAYVAYQPLVRCKDGNTLGFEAFVRTRDRRLPDPRKLFQAAEQLGRVPEIGAIVREAVMADARRLPNDALLFLNLHPLELLDSGFVDWGGGLAPIANRLVLEISEGADLRGVPNAALRVASLRKMGFRIAIDDIGVENGGPASLSRFAPEFLKLDVSLVRGIETDDAKRKIVATVTGFARQLRMNVVAEGVESPEECMALMDLGCDLLQGYLLAKPGPAFPQATLPRGLGR